MRAREVPIPPLNNEMNDQCKTARPGENRPGATAAIECRPTGGAPGPTWLPVLAPARGRSLWAKRWLGRLVLRVCSSGRQECSSENCQLRVFCRCAREDFEAAAAIETRWYVVLAICAGGGILYWFLGT